MVRRVIVRENVLTEHGFFFETGSLYPARTGYIPVSARNFSDPAVGRACDFQRDEATGDISFDFEFDHNNGETRNVEYAHHSDVTFWAKDLVEHLGPDGVRHIDKAAIMGLVLIPADIAFITGANPAGFNDVKPTNV